jgi:uncharacterized membrane protein (DUF4010 family)
VDTLIEHLPQPLVGFIIALALSFLIGLEREEHGSDGTAFHFGGVRTFPLIGLGGFLLVAAFPDNALPFAIGLLVLGILVAVSYNASIQEDIGLTTEISALLTFTLGASAAKELYWISIAAGVVAVILLQEKRLLEGIALRLPRHELRTLLRFLMFTGVILPVVPNHPFSVFEINPFKFWLVVVAVSGVSYVSYLLQLWLGENRGVLVAGLLGGAYSSTVTTVVLARKSKAAQPGVGGHSGAIVAATGVMYIRLWLLLLLFAPPLAHRLSALFWLLGLAAIATGAVLSRRSERLPTAEEGATKRATNPLETLSALSFAGIFLIVLVVTRTVADRFGSTGLLVMAGIMGAADVDPFILGVTQLAGGGLDLGVAALAVVIAAAMNNIMKGLYSVVFGSRPTGRLSLAILLAFAVASVALFTVL